MLPGYFFSALFLWGNETCISKYKTDQIFVKTITKPERYMIRVVFILLDDIWSHNVDG